MLLGAGPAASQPITALPVEAALTRWDMASAHALAARMPSGVDRCTAEGMIADRENRLGDAERLLKRCLATLEKIRSPRADIAVETLVGVYRRLGDYRREHALIERWLHAHPGAGNAEQQADLRNEFGTAAMLRGLSRRPPTGRVTASLRTYINALGTRNVDLTVGGAKMPWMIDTGANYSVVSEGAARRMGLAVRDASYQVSGSTGHTVSTRLAVINDLPVGDIVLHNVVTLVVPDAALLIPTKGATYQIDAALGYPALAQLGRFRIDPDGTFTIDRTGPLLRSGAPLYMNQNTPLVEVEIAGANRLFVIDSGATRTTLFASYAAQFEDRADHWARKQDTSLGLGGRIDEEAAVEPKLEMVAGGRSITDHDVSVALKGDSGAPFLGNLGQPFLTAYGSYTFDFRSMRLLLGPPLQAQVPSIGARR
jgi:predicted aspartyl protease